MNIASVRFVPICTKILNINTKEKSTKVIGNGRWTFMCRKLIQPRWLDLKEHQIFLL